MHCRVTFNCCCGDFSATSSIYLGFDAIASGKREQKERSTTAITVSLHPELCLGIGL